MVAIGHQSGMLKYWWPQGKTFQQLPLLIFIQMETGYIISLQLYP